MKNNPQGKNPSPTPSENTEQHHHDCGHEHGDQHAPGMHIHPIVKNMRVALALNITFTIIEFIGGILTNSVAILSDAIHDLGDSMAIALALVLEKQSTKGRTSNFTYGKRRFSTLAALITSLILVVGSIIIVYHAVPRFFNPQEVHVTGVLWLALLGLAFNGAAVLRLRKDSKNSLSQRAVMLHLMEDALGWLAVMVGGIVMYFTSWYWIDPLLSLGIAAFIMFNAVKNIGSSMKIFLQAKPVDIDQQELTTSLLEIPNVVEVHDMHIWTVDGEYTVLTSHIVVNVNCDLSALKEVKAKAMEVMKTFDIKHPTLQIETSDENCALSSC